MNIKNDTYEINIEEIEEYIDVENVIHEWCQSISFINREIRHPCTRFNGGQSFSYADESFIVNQLGSISNLLRDNYLS
jgi:hypothetical protein